MEGRSLGGEPAAERLDPVRGAAESDGRGLRERRGHRDRSERRIPLADGFGLAPKLFVAAAVELQAQQGGAGADAEAQLEEIGIPRPSLPQL